MAAPSNLPSDVEADAEPDSAFSDHETENQMAEQVHQDQNEDDRQIQSTADYDLSHSTPDQRSDASHCDSLNEHDNGGGHVCLPPSSSLPESTSAADCSQVSSPVTENVNSTTTDDGNCHRMKQPDQEKVVNECIMELVDKYRMYLPAKLKQEHTDGVIVHADADIQHALDLKQAIDGFSFLSPTGHCVRGSAALMDDTATHINSLVDWLEHALELNTCVFVIFTSDLLDDLKLKALANASLWASFCDKKKYDCFIPVYSKSPDDLKNLSHYFKSLKGIQMRRPGWEDSLRKLIDLHIGRRIKRQRIYDEEKVHYLCQHYEDFSIIVENLRVSHPDIQLDEGPLSDKASSFSADSGISISDSCSSFKENSLTNLDVNGSHFDECLQPNPGQPNSSPQNAIMQSESDANSRSKYFKPALLIGLFGCGFVLLVSAVKIRS